MFPKRCGKKQYKKSLRGLFLVQVFEERHCCINVDDREAECNAQKPIPEAESAFSRYGKNKYDLI